MQFCKQAKKGKEIQAHLELKHREHFRSNLLQPLLKKGFLQFLYPDKPNNPKQKYLITEQGEEFLSSLEN